MYIFVKYRDSDDETSANTKKCETNIIKQFQHEYEVNKMTTKCICWCGIAMTIIC